ncbi:MAG: hypothetical protein RBG13Loki_4153 [Promethearchaeota archaeon CR_4]|nr:MAG: hypothetical protein RBG13Loki_4153 [Candidatus Lokiarchaeota archaeon CR_4]
MKKVNRNPAIDEEEVFRFPGHQKHARNLDTAFLSQI